MTLESVVIPVNTTGGYNQRSYRYVYVYRRMYSHVFLLSQLISPRNNIPGALSSANAMCGSLIPLSNKKNTGSLEKLLVLGMG